MLLVISPVGMAPCLADHDPSRARARAREIDAPDHQLLKVVHRARNYSQVCCCSRTQCRLQEEALEDHPAVI